MRSWVLILAVAASACSKPGAEATGTDASARVARPAKDAGSILVHRSTDLRTAMMQAYPEFRGARVVKATATLTRRLDRSVPLDEVIETIKKNEFIVTRGDDALSCEREPFKLLVQGPNLTLSMPLADADVSKLLGAPTSLTTEQLALWFPKVKGATIARERFRLQLSYEASAPRAQYIAWQMVELNTKGSWRVEQWPEGYELKRRPDGGGGGTPDEYSVTLVDTNTSARISVHRNGKSVDLAYELQTEELQ